MQDASAETATAGRLSRLDPNPEAAQLVNEVPTEVLKPEPKSKKRSPKKVAGGEEKTHLDLGAGYKIAHKPGSGWSTFFRVLAKQCNFVEVCGILESGGFDPTNKAQADDLLSKMFVRKDVIEQMVRSDDEWQRHAEKKLADLQKRASEGDDAAKELLAKAGRVKDGEWTGNVREIISTANGFYNALRKGVDIDTDPKKYKNIFKFKESGVVFRQYPLDPKKDEHVCVMIFPSKFVDTIKTAITASRGTSE